ncbi:hypothetical protein N825_29575 [Skermanella stibiiresistens SB22]|uniref:Uncharacterized protein n=1 Tax=Skermanella stibiiresistens SB22 TaxID=1385369 RepID=W9GXB9_9PROT|nr:ribbon-helix-helix protein, CopG family [Skermanella stibiiresistens]EWY36108.1 hypothetical protein N825_29575 [Skermanella stibiiresistens SB22]
MPDTTVTVRPDLAAELDKLAASTEHSRAE